FALVTFRLEGADGAAPDLKVLAWTLERIQRALPGAAIARTQPEHLVAIVDGRVDDVARRCMPLAEHLGRELTARHRHRLAVNSAHCPGDGDNAQWLLVRSAPKTVVAGAAAAAERRRA